MTDQVKLDTIVENIVDKQVDEKYEEGRLFVREMLSGNYNLKVELELQRKGPRVFKTGDAEWRGGPQKYNKTLFNPSSGLMQTLMSSFELLVPGGRSQKHGHQNPALLYVLEGHGYDVSDGERVDWEEGDSVFVASGTVHQHFNADPNHEARVLIIKGKPLYMFAHAIFQGFVEKSPKTPVPGFEDYKPPII